MVVYPDRDISTFMFVFCHHPIFSSLCLPVDLLLALDYVEIVEASAGGFYELSSLNVLTIVFWNCISNQRRTFIFDLID